MERLITFAPRLRSILAAATARCSVAYFAYLNSGIRCDGVVQERYRGTPPGGPLSPLLANVLLDEVDMYRELRALGALPGVAHRVAANSTRWWRNSDGLLKAVLTIAYFDRLGLPRLW